MNKQNKNRKKQIKRMQREAARKSLPMSPNQLQELFSWLEGELEKFGCDHTRDKTTKWLKKNEVEITIVTQWLDDHGGYCDCEVLANCEEVFVEAMREI